jgi:hypothetical protein
MPSKRSKSKEREREKKSQGENYCRKTREGKS